MILKWGLRWGGVIACDTECMLSAEVAEVAEVSRLNRFTAVIYVSPVTPRCSAVVVMQLSDTLNAHCLCTLAKCI